MNPSPASQKAEPPREPRGGSIGTGISLGVFALYALYLWATITLGAPYSWSNSLLAGPAAFIPLTAYLGLAIVLAVKPRTSRWGTGLLIGLGIFTLLGGGLCVAALVQVGIGRGNSR
jgi:hypothetical protein